MKSLMIVMVIAVVLVILPAKVSAENYVLRPGDVISVDIVSSADISGVFGTPSRSSTSSGLGFGGLTLQEVTVRPDGMVSIPLVGEVNVDGMSPSEVSAFIVERLNRYLVEPPNVSVNLVKVHMTRIYVLGQVNHPGAFELGKNISLVDAIAMAGGWTDGAAKKKISIIRKNMQVEPTKVNLLDVLEKGDTSKNLVLNEGDIVYLSSNGKIDFIRDIVPFINTSYEIRHY
ncbi:polysaccharide biosynthesis/export family protein [Azotosporobacter soli]|uniref:polysaccharide biosynthesis/export family protein n=1 Tax=Azotosporobacter soli TaxID=3055040 RepID=UPI0031FEDCE5